ncbi:hypothetical protein AC628_32255 [Bradyrhizobium sp. NAS96.2]|nr:hypothetical protein AC628_32255 [Bradyrhizobium sp. NAS96.2]
MTGGPAESSIGELHLPNQGISLNYAMPVQARFLVRMGTTGWMVYDRERKGPALLKNCSLAGKLTREEAEQLKQKLMSWNTQPI